jgi:hexosaminidase
VNIGGDETFELGRGVSKHDVEARGRGAVYVEHLKRIAEPLVAAGHDLLFWGDILRNHPELIAELPAGMTTIAWMYEAPRPSGETIRIPRSLGTVLDSLGIDLSAMADGGGFAAQIEVFAGSGLPFWVAPGTSSWNSLVGRLDNALANLHDAAVRGSEAGATGFLVTDWGDNGHLQPPAVSVPPIVYGGAVSWCAATNADLDLSAVIDRWVFADDRSLLGDVLDRVGRVWRQTGQQALNGSPLQAALCPRQFQLVTGEPDVEQVREVIAVLEGALADAERARPTASDGGIVVRELRCAIRLARHGGLRLLGRAGGETTPAAVLRADLEELVDEYEACWLARSRPGGLVDSARHLRSALDRYVTD